MLVPASELKLGKKPHRNDNRNLLLTNYLVAGRLPMVPQSWAAWRKKRTLPWGMHLNSKLGTCGIATPANMDELFVAVHGGDQINIPDDQVLREYEVQGYLPGRPETDQGVDPLDVLKRWKNVGLFGRPPIVAFVASSPGNLQNYRAGCYLYGASYLGLRLPITAQRQLDRGEPWDVVQTNTGEDAPGSWGGHAVMGHTYAFGHGVREHYDCATWNGDVEMTPAFLEAYCDCCYFVLDPDWCAPDEEAASMFKHDELLADLALMA